MWGCFHRFDHVYIGERVFPTHVGVFLSYAKYSGMGSCLPHACGGVSLSVVVSRVELWSSPRMWGCFYLAYGERMQGIVFPTHVGVFPRLVKMPIASIGLPHACGGVSVNMVESVLPDGSSPRMWGCFCLPEFHDD